MRLPDWEFPSPSVCCVCLPFPLPVFVLPTLYSSKDHGHCTTRMRQSLRLLIIETCTIGSGKAVIETANDGACHP